MARTIPTSTATRDAPNNRLRMSYDEWLAWDVAEGSMSEWVDGEVIVFMPPKIVHQRLLVWLSALLGLFVRHASVGELLIAPVEMRLAERRSSREPDILVVLNAHLDRVTEDRIDGPADLVIEIVSDDSVTRDRRDKLAEYEAAGIPEYWILDPRPGQQRSDFFQLVEGRYQAMPLDERGRYQSRGLPGFWLDPTWLWDDPRPSPMQLLERITATG